METFRRTEMDPHRNDKFKHMENKLETVWSTELDEYFEERYGIDIGEIICDEILKTMQSERQ